MSDWHEYWESHARAHQDSAPQVQVLRTWQKRPVTDDVFESIVRWVLQHLQLAESHRALDLGCGNGLITRRLADRCQAVVAVDFSESLLRHVAQGRPNITTELADVRACCFPEGYFDRVLMYAALQYLSESEAAAFFRQLWTWLRPGGRAVIGDIPDRDRMWNFFDTPARRGDYFCQLACGRPIIGTWFSPTWLKYLAADIGFEVTEILEQPADFPFRHFRLDLLLQK